MPVDAQIPLMVRPPEAGPNPLDSLARVLQIKQEQQLLPLKIQAAQQQQQEGQLRVQQMQRAVDDQKAQDAAWAGALVPDENGKPTIDRGKLTGLLPGHLLAGANEILDKLDTSRENILKLRTENQAKIAEHGGGIGKFLADSQYAPGAYRTILPIEVSNGITSPDNAKQILAQLDQADQQDPTGAAAKAIVKAHSDKLMDLAGPAFTTAAARKEASDTGAARFAAEQPKIASDVQKAVSDAAIAEQKRLGTEPITPYQQATLDKTGAEHNPTEASLAFLVAKGKAPGATPEQIQAGQAADAALKRLDQSKIAARPVTNVNLPGYSAPSAAAQKLTGDDFLKTLPPPLAAQVRAVATGAAVMPSATSRSQGAQELRQLVFNYDPTYTDQRAQIRKAFTAGADGRNIGALNTAAVHLDQLADASSALANGSFRPGNAVYNAVSQMFGAAAPTNFEGIKAAVSGEMATALKGNATDQEINNIKATIDRSSSPAQLAGIVNENMKIIAAKINTYQERYRQQIPNDTVWSPTLPAARDAFAKHGVQTGNPIANAQASAQGGPPPGARVQRNTATGQTRWSTDGGKTWQTQ